MIAYTVAQRSKSILVKLKVRELCDALLNLATLQGVNNELTLSMLMTRIIRL